MRLRGYQAVDRLTELHELFIGYLNPIIMFHTLNVTLHLPGKIVGASSDLLSKLNEMFLVYFDPKIYKFYN